MAMINRTGLSGRGDFIGFTFDGRHSSEFNIIQVSSGNRMGKELLPSPKDITTQVTGVDGSYYFNSTYGNRTFSINFAFDDLRENDFRAMQYWLNKKEPAQLVFDEAPYKSWTVKISNAPNLKFICFDETLKGKIVRIYKGEGTVNFVSYSIVAKAPFPFLEAYNWDYINNKYYKVDKDNAKDTQELQLSPSLILDSRLGGSNPGATAPTGWFNFDEWKESSRLKTQSELDLGATSWESIQKGFNFNGQVPVTDTAQQLSQYKASNGKHCEAIDYWKLDVPENDILLNKMQYRRFGYLSETLFGGLSTYHKGDLILLDSPEAERFVNRNGNTITSWKWQGKVQNVDYRRKMTMDPSAPDNYVSNQITYPDIPVSRGGLGTNVTVTDKWAGKIGPVRGITGKWCHVYNPGNYKTFPKIILTVLDKRSMITRSRCNYPSTSATKNADGRFTLKYLGSSNYADWRYATITLYPMYEGETTSQLTEADVLGRISLDLSKLTPASKDRDNPTVSGNSVTIDGKPTGSHFVIDNELRLLYRATNIDTNPDQGWGPKRNSANIPSPYQYYNTYFEPTNDIRNNAIIAGDFFEIPPYELEEWNGKKIRSGRYLIAFNSPAAACVGPYIWLGDHHFADKSPATDYTWVAQRVVWDINYL